MSSESNPSRLDRQIEFILEIDKLKHVYRQSYLIDQSRKENDAEHSWHLAMMTAILAEYAAPGLDIMRVMKMVLVHDLVEIDAGDTFIYAVDMAEEKARREMAAADRIFALLPPDQAGDMRALWEEFEARVTPEAKFARAIDRLEPVLLNCHTQGRSWREHGITMEQVIARNQPIIADASPMLEEYFLRLIRDAVTAGYLK